MEINYQLYKLDGSMFVKNNVKTFQTKFKIFYYKKQHNLHKKCLKQGDNFIKRKNK
jgi:hypothetical protein